jgi:hypothetical protein
MSFLDVSILWYSVKVMKLKFILLLCYLLLLGGCRDTDPQDTVQTVPADEKKVQLQLKGCRACHPDINPDAFHDFPCTQCHRGNPDAAVRERAHSGLVSQPAHPDFMAEFCGKCHPDQVNENLDSLHFTLRNEVNMVRKHFGSNETLRSLTEIPQSPTPTTRPELIDDMLRRRCLRCHVYSAGDDYPYTKRGTGCAACHMKFIEGELKSHAFTGTVDDYQCLSCHYGNFVGADYYGRFEHDFNEEYRTPYTTREDFIRPYGVEYHDLTPDIHQQRGLACVDCHSGNQLMSGAVQEKLKCSTCHLWKRESTEPLPSNLIVEDNKLVLIAGLSGRKHAVPQAIHPAHEQYGRKVECQVCHAQWSFSDETTHLIRSDTDDYDPWERLIVQSSSEVESFLKNNLSFDKEELAPAMKDQLSGAKLPGVWHKGYTQRRWEKINIKRDTDGVIKVFRPILDLRVSYMDDEEYMAFDNETGSRPVMLPYTPHTTGPAGMFYRDRFADLINQPTHSPSKP